MARARHKKKKKKKVQETTGLESVGWGFWLVCFVVFYGPGWYVVYRYAYEDRQVGIFPWVGAFVLAALGAGFLSFLVNFALQKRVEMARKKFRKAK